MNGSRVIAALVVALLACGAGQAHADAAADACGSAKVKGAARYVKAVVACDAAALRAGGAVDPDCLANAAARIASVFDHAEAAGGCVTTGDDPAARSRADSARNALDALLASGATADAQVCAAGKRTAAGRHVLSRLNCYAKGATRSRGPDDQCLAKSDATLATAFASAESRGGCATTADADAARAVDDAAVEALVRLLSPVCGDALQGPSQECEIGDDAACPALCSRDCVCVPPPVCGDGVAVLPEECDDGNLVDGDGCSADCHLENASALCAGVASAPGTAIDAVFVSDDFVAPTSLTAPRLDPARLFVTERAGFVRILHVADNNVTAAPFLDISDLTTTGGERGLFSIAFDPDYEHNGRFFVSHSNAAGDGVLARYEVSADPDVADVSTRKELLVVPHPGAQNHYAGQLQFSPDGYLYWSIGDGGDGANSLDDASLLGKILRLDVNHDSAPFVSVPPTNPHYVDGTSDREYVWAKGLRNPWRFSFDRQTGDLYIGDVGANNVEEVDFAPATSTGGENYGWYTFEGSSCHKPPCPDPPTGFTFPVYEYPHGRPCAVMGGYVYRGCAMPDLRGTYFFSDLCAAFVDTFQVSGGVAANFTDRTRDAKSAGAYFTGVISWGEDARGEIYIINGNNRIYRMEPQ